MINLEDCLLKGTMILMSDFTLKEIENVKIGDEVIGIQVAEKSNYKRFKRTKVNKIMNRIGQTIIIETEKSTIECTQDKRLMGGTVPRVSGTDWKQAKAYSPYEKLKYLGIPKQKTHDYYKGWLCGYIEGDGCFFNKHNKYRGFEAVSIDEEIRNSLIDNAHKFGIELRLANKMITSKKSFTNGNTYKMVTTTESKVAEKLEKLSEFKYNQSMNFYEGYIGGIIDADGTITDTIRISQLPNTEVVKHIHYSLEQQNINYVVEDITTRLRISYRMGTRLKILWNCSPVCIRKRDNLILGHTIKSVPKIEIKALKIGRKCRVYNIETETGNYIANGFIVQGSGTDGEQHTE